MELKVILASVSLGFGFLLLVMTSVMIHSHPLVKTPSVNSNSIKAVKYVKCDPNKIDHELYKKTCNQANDNYDGVLATFALALIASLCHIASFVWAAIKTEDWMPWTGIHVGVLVLTLISFALGLVYKVQVQPDAYRESTSPSKDRTPVWENGFAENQGAFWGMTFIIITAFDFIFCIAAVVVGFVM